ncbi:unnamed protein product [Closterium sp. NIES-65]|nr:unnamed protein product [Closterium sp. NIES-65]
MLGRAAVFARSLARGQGGSIAEKACKPFSTSAPAVAAASAAGNENTTNDSLTWKLLRATGAVGGAVLGVAALADVARADEAEHGLHAPAYPWPHDGIFSSYDHASIRRGHQVYQQVCATCHSMSLVSYRDLIGVAYTEDEVKALAAEVEVEDGPNDEGEMFLRPGKPSDKLPNPYANEQSARFANGGAYPPDLSLISKAQPNGEVKALAAEVEVEDGPNDEGEMFLRPGKPSDKLPNPYANEQAARFANGGAYPPDLSLISKARHDGQNYIYALLTGYREPPAGISVREGLHYNPYFPGGAIAMPKMLNDGGVEYEDGTPATESQQAKDVVTFLAWAAEPEMDERKLMGVKWIFILSLVWLQAIYYKRWRWAPIKSRRVIVDVVN